MCARENSYRLPKRAGRGPADSISESILRQKHVFAVIISLAWAHKQGVNLGSTSIMLYVDTVERDGSTALVLRLCNEHKDRVLILRLSLARLSTVFSKQPGQICQPRWNTRRKLSCNSEAQNKTVRAWLLRHWEMAMRGQENVGSYPKRANKNLFVHYPLWLNRTTTKRRKTRSLSHSRMKTPMYRFRWALVTRLNANPCISATQTQKAWSGSSSWKSWRGAGKYSNRGKRRLHAGRNSPIYGQAAESRGGMVRSGTCSRF